MNASIHEYLEYLAAFSAWLHAQGREADGSFQVHDNAPNFPYKFGA